MLWRCRQEQPDAFRKAQLTPVVVLSHGKLLVAAEQCPQFVGKPTRDRKISNRTKEWRITVLSFGDYRYGDDSNLLWEPR
jgi:hypothetical protein